MTGYANMSKPNGVILWQGPSLLDGAPIVAIAVGLRTKSKNSKTGGMVQTYILRSDVSPVAAVKSGADASICGECPYRGDGTGKDRRCYVNVGQGPNAVWKAFKRGVYPTLSGDLQCRHVVRYRDVRLGTYGDPAAVPVRVWKELLTDATGHTGYTHQWKNVNQRLAFSQVEALKYLCMASVDTVAESREAQALGWRTFRADTTRVIGKQKGESLCPASKEAGKKLTGEKCLACNGKVDGRRGNITIPVHGGFSVMAAARKLNQIGVRVES